MPGPGLHRCDDCGTIFEEEELIWPIPGLADRVDPGGPMPSGECPREDCGALCYPYDAKAEHEQARLIDADAVEHIRRHGTSPVAIGPGHDPTNPATDAMLSLSSPNAKTREFSEAYLGVGDLDVSLHMDPNATPHEMRAASVESYLGDVLRVLDEADTLDATKVREEIPPFRDIAARARHFIRRALDELHNEREARKEIVRGLQGRRRGVRNSAANPVNPSEDNMADRDKSKGAGGDESGQADTSTTGQPARGGDFDEQRREQPNTDVQDGEDKSGRADETQADRA